MISTFVQDIRYGARALARSPGFAAVAILTLALGIGANTAIFSLVNGVLLRSLPYRDASRLAFVAASNRRQGSKIDVTSYPDFADWRAQNHVFTGLAAYRPQNYNLSGGTRPERIRGVRVTEDFFSVLEVAPALGRTFLPHEYQAGNDHVVLVSDGLWRRLFGGDPALVGKTLRLNDELYTVVGVLPPWFEFPPNESPSLYTPLAPDAHRSHGWLWTVARLRPGISLRKAQIEMATIAQRLEQQYPKTNKGEGTNVLALQEAMVGDLRPAFLVFVYAVGLVLLIACANVANLLLSRTAGRERELAVRAALGAGRGRLVRQLLTESALLGVLGGSLGLVLAVWGVDALRAMLSERIPLSSLASVRIDGWVLGFTFAVALLTGIVFGLAPAWSASRVQLSESLKEGSRSTTGALRPARVRSVLVVSEVALALILLAGAGLMIKSFWLLSKVKTGVDVSHVLAMDVSLEESRYAQRHVRAGFLEQAAERVRSLPGVRSTSWVADLPLTDNSDGMGFSIAGRSDPASGRREISVNVVGPGYFETLGIPLLRGRDFSNRDTEAAPGVVLINQAAVRQFWPREDPLGRQITFDGKFFFSIVGVAGDVRQLGQASETSPEVYLSYLQNPVDWPYRTLIVRTAGDPLKMANLVEQAVWSVNKNQPLSHVRTMEQVLAESVAQPRAFVLLLGAFAALALALASVGIYGVVSYSVAQRTHEVGVRMALGAESFDVLRLMVGQGMWLVAIGLGAGLGGALALTRFLSGFLYGVRATDPVTFTAVALGLGLVGLAACYVPARRATEVDPMVALRYE